MPALPIERGRPGPGLLAHVLVAKYCDHLPLYRQSDIYAREGVELDRSTMADWVGKRRGAAGAAGRRDRRPCHRRPTGCTPTTRRCRCSTPAAARPRPAGSGSTCATTGPCGDRRRRRLLYRYSPDRKGEHPRAHLKDFRGFLQADGYAGFDDLYEARRAGRPPHRGRVLGPCPPQVLRRASRPAARRSPRRRSSASPSSTTSRPRSAAAARRAAPLVRQEAAPLLDALAGLDDPLPKLPGKSGLAAAIRYALTRWTALTPLPRRRSPRDRQQRRRARHPAARPRAEELSLRRLRRRRRTRRGLYTLIETAKLNGLDPEAYVPDVLTPTPPTPPPPPAAPPPWNIREPEQHRAAA